MAYLGSNTDLGSDLIAITGGYAYNSPQNYVTMYDDFLGQTTAGAYAWGASTASGGSSAVQNGITLTSQTIGLINLFTGGSTTGGSALQLPNIFVLGGGVISLTWRSIIPTLSNGTDRFTIYQGLSVGGNSTPTDGIWFQYSDNVNSGQWQIICRGSSTSTTTNTSTAADTSFHKFRIDINAAGSSVTFYIDGTSVGTIATHIPTAAIGPWANILKSAGTNSLNLILDYFKAYYALTTAR